MCRFTYSSATRGFLMNNLTHTFHTIHIVRRTPTAPRPGGSHRLERAVVYAVRVPGLVFRSTSFRCIRLSIHASAAG